MLQKFIVNRHIEVAKFSVLRIGRLTPMLSSLHSHSGARRIKSIYDPIRNRNRNLPVSSEMSQSTAPLRTIQIVNK